MSFPCNNLSAGRIPSSTQLQSFNDLDFIGNPELCGAPLLKNCIENEDTQALNPSDENGEGFQRSWFYIGMATGFVAGFWGVCGSLLWKTAWRHAYFKFLDNIKDRVYVGTVLKLSWLSYPFGRYCFSRSCLKGAATMKEGRKEVVGNLRKKTCPCGVLS